MSSDNRPTITPDGLYTEDNVASYLDVKADTLRVWRSKSRRAGTFVGPVWKELPGTGRARIIRYFGQDLLDYVSRGTVQLQPKKRPGRPRKGDGMAI